MILMFKRQMWNQYHTLIIDMDWTHSSSLCHQGIRYEILTDCSSHSVPFQTQPELINTIRQSLRQQCANYGDVTKVTIHDVSDQHIIFSHF